MITEPDEVLIVGGLTGIGAEVARMLREERSVNPITPSVEELDSSNQFSIWEYVAEQGPFSHIVYSAGHNRLKWVSDMSKQHLIDHFSVNTFGPILLASAHLQLYPEVPVNMIVVGSDAARIPMRGSIAYNSSKAALVFAVKNLARELAGDGWRINAVSPAMVEDTPMTEYIDDTVPEFRGWSPEYAKEYERMGSPMGRRITKTEVAHLTVDLLYGPETINGANFEITGGR